MEVLTGLAQLADTEQILGQSLIVRGNTKVRVAEGENKGRVETRPFKDNRIHNM